MGSAAMACPRGDVVAVVQRAPTGAGTVPARRIVGGRYELLRRIGSGASGCVFEAVDTLATGDEAGRHVAVKTILTSDLDDEGVAEVEVGVHSALNGAGARAVGAAAGDAAAAACPYLSRYLDSFTQPSAYGCYGCSDDEDEADETDEETGGGGCSNSFGSCGSSVDEACIVSEFCDGGALSDVAKYVRAAAAQRVTEEEMADLCASMVLGLRFMHARGAIHRDVKSDNVLLTTAGGCKIVDFGISTFVAGITSGAAGAAGASAGSAAQRSTLCGTPAFMAPEVITAASSSSLAFRTGSDDDGDDDDSDDCDDSDYMSSSVAAAPCDSPATSPVAARTRMRARGFGGRTRRRSSGSSGCSQQQQQPQQGYSAKADIWSVGITAIELADGVAPAHRAGNRWHNPYFLLSSIAHRPAPQVDAPNRAAWSPLFHDFLRCCLQKDARQRASAAELAAHPFVAQACADLEAHGGRSARIAGLVRRVALWRRAVGRRQQQQQQQQQRRRQRHVRREASTDSCSSASSSSDSWEMPMACEDRGTFVITGKQPSAAATSPMMAVVAPLELLPSLHLKPIVCV